MSCNQNDPNELGRLSIKILYNGETVSNAITALASSQKNLDAGIYVKEVHSDLKGFADFGALSPGSYYCDSYKYINNNQIYLYGTSIVVVEPGHIKSVELIIKEK